MDYSVHVPTEVLAIMLLFWWVLCYEWLEPGQLLAWRKQRRWSRERLAEEISNKLPKSLHPRTISRWERGQTQPSLKMFQIVREVVLEQEKTPRRAMSLQQRFLEDNRRALLADLEETKMLRKIEASLGLGSAISLAASGYTTNSEDLILHKLSKIDAALRKMETII